jgi:CRP/FNR family cyclic AMP-dependent transcriptional regulator
VASAEPLKQSDLFARFDDETLERIANPFHEVELPANHVLIEPRMTGAGLFLICDGTVEVEARDIRRELGPGQVVGEISLVEDDHARRARVVTKTPVRCLTLSRNDFDELVAEVPGLRDAVRELAGRRLAELEG